MQGANPLQKESRNAKQLCRQQNGIFSGRSTELTDKVVSLGVALAMRADRLDRKDVSQDEIAVSQKGEELDVVVDFRQHNTGGLIGKQGLPPSISGPIAGVNGLYASTVAM